MSMKDKPTERDSSHGDPRTDQDDAGRHAGPATELYEFLQKHLRPRLAVVVPPQMEVEDLLCETFLAILPALDGLREKNCLLSYCMKTAKSIVIHSGRERVRFQLFARERAGEASSDLNGRNLEADDLYYSLRSSLKPAEAQLFDLLYVRGLKHDELRAEMQIPDRLLRLRKHRLRRKLQRIAVRWNQQ